ncbi:MAG: sensor histidine kinase [Phycisphaerae bacterium]
MEIWQWLLVALLAATIPVAAVMAVRIARHRWKVDDQAKDSRHQQHMTEVSRLVGGLAHEIKNPLSTVNLNLTLLLEDIDQYRDEQHQRWARRLRSVQEEAQRLRAILDDFLRFAGKIDLQLRPVDLVELIDELTDFFAPQAQASRVVMRTSLPDSPVICRVDPDLIKQSLLNLMLNAVDAMGEGGELLIRLKSDGKSARLEVVDTGEGIPLQLQPRVFEIYFSTKKGGSGIGLPMTRRLIEEHGGSIHLDSEPGKGTQFTIELPCAAEV